MRKDNTAEISTNAKVTKLNVRTVVLMHTTATDADAFFLREFHLSVKAHNGSAGFCNSCSGFGIMKSIQTDRKELIKNLSIVKELVVHLLRFVYNP